MQTTPKYTPDPYEGFNKAMEVYEAAKRYNPEHINEAKQKVIDWFEAQPEATRKWIVERAEHHIFEPIEWDILFAVQRFKKDLNGQE